MTQDIWLNLPVKDLEKAKAFYLAIGFENNPGPGNSEMSASFRIGRHHFILMLFQEKVFEGFTKTSISDTSKGAEMLVSISAASKEEVDSLQQKAVQAGGVAYAPAGGANGMYGCGFSDPDGHRWNVLFMG